MLAKNWLDDLKNKVDLVDLGRRYQIRWDTRSREPRACCPFHEEKTPSFYALQNPRVGLPRFVCYGACGRSWSALSFLIDGQGIDFRSAVEELAKLAGLAVPSSHETEASCRNREASQTRRASILTAIASAQDFFTESLAADTVDAAKARAYLAARGLNGNIGSWALGFAPGGDALVRHLDSLGIAPDIAEAAYLTRRSESNRRYDFLRQRVTIPWRDRAGRIVAHDGRDLVGAEPKYLHPGDIPGLFQKAEILFGLSEALPAIRKTGAVCIVEGKFSAITPHLHGIENIVACSGKAFGPAHAKLLLSAGARRVTFLFDSDEAGRKGTAAAMDTAFAEGLPSRVARLPDQLDPDDFLRSLSA